VAILSIGFEDGQQFELKVMDPLCCLMSRVGNICHPAMARDDPTSKRQLSAAVDILRAYVDETLAEGEIRSAQKSVMGLVCYLRTHPLGRRAHAQLHVDPLEAILCFADDQRFDERWRRLTFGPALVDLRQFREGQAERIAASAGQRK